MKKARTFIFGSALVLSALTWLPGCASTPERTEAPILSVHALSPDEQEQQYFLFVNAERKLLEQSFPDIEIPNVQRDRFVDEPDWAKIHADCMTGLGFPASVRPDGGVAHASTADEQKAAQALAIFTCEVPYPVDPRYQVPLNEQQLKYLHNYYLSDLIPCLESKGFSVEPAPSLTTFMENCENSPWSPYSNVSPNSEEEWLEINRLCPQQPEFLFGTP